MITLKTKTADDFKAMKKKDLEYYLFIGEQLYDRPYTTAEQKAEIEAARAELESRMPKKDGSISPAQRKVVDFIKKCADLNGELHGKNLEDNFNMRVIENCLHKGLIERKGKSRLREDDREMVYWHVYCVVPSKLEKVLK